ncbi:MAG: ribose 5-phosphate isomerase B [Candidatus Omnitrophica bacterium]|nr:ribose 5-phosphate isomerase B [Candidatus Omnitrophota bacterium]
MKRLLIASDHAGFSLKEKIKIYLEKKGFYVKDLGTHSKERCDYPQYAFSLAKQISQGRYRQGILICKTGIGNTIVANRLPGVRAALCYNTRAARLSRQHNNSNVLVLGALFVKDAQAKRILNIWLNTTFLGGRHRRRLEQIREIERQISEAYKKD